MSGRRGLALISAVVLFATAVPMLSRPFAVEDYRLRPGVDAYPDVIGTAFDVDEDGVAVYRDATGSAYLHPVNAAQRALGDLVTYRKTNDATALTRARNAADALIAEGVDIDGRLYFPYGLGVDVGTGAMSAPWYSGMAEGQGLSLLVRLAGATGNDAYRQAAQQVLATFDPMRPGGGTTHVDGRGYYWVDDYVTSQPDPVLNGFVFALFGLYDDWSAYGDATARTYFDAGATTVLHNMYMYRDPGRLSWYDLDHRQRAKPGYHEIHIRQLSLLASMTGDPRFAQWSELLASDTP